jgi:hypothetical protein
MSVGWRGGAGGGRACVYYWLPLPLPLPAVVEEWNLELGEEVQR